jgi:hypothetical protein
MSEPIKVGDLVMVVRGCGCYLGEPYRVKAMDIGNKIYFRCIRCRKYQGIQPLVEVHGNRRDGYFPLSWLKRIPPLDELEGVDEKETLHA